MPVYDYKCKYCGQEQKDVWAKVHEMVIPCDCGQVADRQLTGRININMGASGSHGYYDENLDCYIHTNKQRREEMLKQGVSERGATPKLGCAWV